MDINLQFIYKLISIWWIIWVIPMLYIVADKKRLITFLKKYHHLIGVKSDINESTIKLSRIVTLGIVIISILWAAIVFRY